ncbi:MlaD family protein [Nocardia abscessus]|jgi:phospholipid/cholesterol/gamma-HCH transport system substrate-binding protein|uniref:MlaD family protein n=1 Tax=Nocardia TaxID=1817 RepID=UPI0018938AE6|nr:MlaD family protein [Nocardia abscessus]MBF6209143.1 MCE family protein [Streptomyces gardneri]MBF6472641.1 MCE family protein [Nocardia abscessus]
MQRALSELMARLRSRAVSVLRRIGGNKTLLGLMVVAVAITVLVAATGLYLHPLGRKTIAFETTDASALTAGEEVRVAGISVGKVASLSIQPDTVRVDLDIKGDVFVGSNTTVDVRMLTPVGGYAVTLIPSGSVPLDKDAVIPPERVTVPYSIADLLQAAPHVTDKVDGGTIQANIDQVADALQHNAPSVKSLIDGLNSIATVMDHQRDQVRTIMDTAAEYMQTFNRSRDFIFELLRQVEIVTTRYNITKAGFDQAYADLGDIIGRVEPFMKFYLNHSDEIFAAITRTRDSIGEFQKTMGPALDRMTELRAQLQQWLGPDGLKAIGGGRLLASDICIPTPGRTC